MRVLVLIITLYLFLAPSSAYCDELTLEKKAAIEELLHISGGIQVGEICANEVLGQMLQFLGTSKPDLDPKLYDIIRQEARSLINEELVIKESFLPFFYPVYHKYLTLEEINGLIRFYETPLGQKLISVMPKLTQELMKASAEWGESLEPKLDQKISDRLKEEG